MGPAAAADNRQAGIRQGVPAATRRLKGRPDTCCRLAGSNSVGSRRSRGLGARESNEGVNLTQSPDVINHICHGGVGGVGHQRAKGPGQGGEKVAQGPSRFG